MEESGELKGRGGAGEKDALCGVSKLFNGDFKELEALLELFGGFGLLRICNICGLFGAEFGL